MFSPQLPKNKIYRQIPEVLKTQFLLRFSRFLVPEITLFYGKFRNKIFLFLNSITIEVFEIVDFEFIGIKLKRNIVFSEYRRKSEFTEELIF